MKIKRVYKGSDADMISKIAGIYHDLEKYLSDFTAFDPSINASYLNAFKTAFDEAGNLSLDDNDEQETTEDAIYINESVKVLARCRQKYMEVKFYAGKAFEGKKGVLKEFGEGAYSKVCNSRLQMVQFMETLHGVAEKYKTELLAQQYTQPAIDAIATLAAELRNANLTQQLQKQERPAATTKRIEALNRLYAFGQQAGKAALLVFRHSPTHRNMFRLAERHHPKVSGAWLHIAAGGTRKMALPKLLKKFRLTLVNQSAAGLLYWRANTINETPAQKFTLEAGEALTIEAESPAKKFLMLQNISAKAAQAKLIKEMKGKGS